MKRSVRVVAALGSVGVLAVGIASISSSASADTPHAQQAAATGFMIASNMNNLCLDIRASNAGPGVGVDMSGCNGFPNQRWKMFGNTLVSDLNQRCLDINDGNIGNGAGIDMWDCNGNGVQQWLFEGNQLRNPVSNRCLTIVDANPGNGAATVIRDCVGAPNQQWHQF